MRVGKVKKPGTHMGRVRLVLWYVVAVAGSLIMLLPFAWMISTSFKTENEIFTVPIRWLPTQFTIQNYSKALQVVPILKCMLNTVLIAIPKILGEVFISALVAFGFARFEFKGRNAMFMVMLATMMLPYEVTMIPTFMAWSSLGFADSYVPLVLPAFCGSASFIFFLRMYFETVPRDYEEAAWIDGASNLKVFRMVFLPLAKPALITICLWSFMGTWNDLLGQLIYIDSQAKYTIQLALASFSSMTGETLWGPLMAASFMALIPVLALLLYAQKYFMEGVKMGGIKG